MPTILCSAMIARLRPVLLDPTPGTTWPDARLLQILSQAERKVCELRPEAYQVSGSIPLVAGVEQALPAGSTGLFDIPRNAVSGVPCQQASRTLMDSALRFAPAQAPAVDVDCWSHDSRSPLQFVVTPPNTGAGAVIARRGLFPPDLTVVGQTLYLEDIYEMGVFHAALSIAYLEDGDRKDTAKSAMHDGLYKAAVGARAAAQGGMAPNHANPGGN